MESLKQREHRITYIDYSSSTPLIEGVDYESVDIAGNKVKVDVEYYNAIQQKRIDETLKYIATIKNTLSVEEFEGLISKSGVIKK